MSSFFKPKAAKVVDVTPSQFSGLRGQVASTLSGLMAGGGPEWTGPFVAPMTPEEKSLLGIVQQQGMTTPPTEAAAGGLLNRILSGEFLRPETNPFLQSTYESAIRPLTRQWEDVIMPNLRSGFTKAGHLIQASSPFIKSVEQAGTRFMENLGDVAADIFGGNYARERGLMQQAIPQALQVGEEPMRRATIALQVSQLPRMIEQMGIDRALAEFTRRTGVQLTASQIAGMLSQAQTVVQPGQPSPFSQVLQGATQAVMPFALTGFNPFSGIGDLFGSSSGGSLGSPEGNPFSSLFGMPEEAGMGMQAFMSLAPLLL